MRSLRPHPELVKLTLPSCPHMLDDTVAQTAGLNIHPQYTDESRPVGVQFGRATNSRGHPA